MVFPVIILDSSFLVSLFRNADANSMKARMLARENSNEQMLLNDLVLFETLTIIAYKDGTARAKAVYDEIATHRNINIYHLSPEEKNGALEQFFSQKGKLGAVDISVLYLAKKCSAGILAFDEQINKAYGKN